MNNKKDTQTLNNLFNFIKDSLLGYNYTEYKIDNNKIEKLFDFNFANYIFTFKLDNNGIHLANNVDVYDNENIFVDNCDLDEIFDLQQED